MEGGIAGMMIFEVPIKFVGGAPETAGCRVFNRFPWRGSGIYKLAVAQLCKRVPAAICRLSSAFLCAMVADAL